MSIAQQLSNVGYNVTRQTEKPTLAQIVDAVMAPITRPRKIVISRAGDFVRARYEGRKTCVLALTAEQARKNLKMFDGGAA